MKVTSPIGAAEAPPEGGGGVLEPPLPVVEPVWLPVSVVPLVVDSL